MLYKLLDQTWGHEGFLQWLIYLSGEYQRRLNILTQSCTKYLRPYVCSWEIPAAGMFLWLQVDWTKHPSTSSKFHKDEAATILQSIEDNIYVKAKERGVQVSKGSWFRSTSASVHELYFRLTFAAAPEASLEGGVKILAQVIDAEFC